MNWTKVKVILILLFACVNVFLIFATFFPDNDEGISHAAVDNTVQILQKRGVKVVPEKIETHLFEMNAIDVRNIANINSDFIKNLEGGGWDSEGDNVYVRGNEWIIFDGYLFDYDNQNPQAQSASESDLYNSAILELRDLGFVTDDMKPLDTRETDGDFILRIGQINGGYFMFDSVLEITLRDGAIININGCWNEVAEVLPLNGKIEGSVKALIEFTTDPKRTEDDNEIVSVTAGYKISDAADYEKNIEIQMLPTWRIVTNAGNAFYYDARAK